MLSKNDLINYLKEMELLEADMFYAYKGCKEKIEDQEIKKICTDLHNSEAAHSYALKKVIKLLTISH